MNPVVRLVAQREIVSRLQQKAFRISFAVILLIVVVACVLPSFFSDDGDDDGSTRYDVAVATGVDGAAARLTSTSALTVHRVSAGEARTKVKNGDWDAAVLPGGTLLAESSDAGVVGVVQEVYRQLTVTDRLRQQGLGATQVQQALQVSPLAVSTTKSSSDGQRQAIGIITVVLLFSQLTTFCTWVAMGVVEEKASRVVELILSSIRPLQLLTGKLLGIGALAAGQILAIGVVAIVAGSVAGTISIPASAILVIVVGFVGFVLGFALFASLAAALGSTVSRQEEVSGVLAPVTISLLVCYGASFAATSSPDSTLARLASIVPPFSCIAMPGRVARGSVPVLDLVLAAVLLAAAAALLLVVAARIYRASVLHSGTRVSLARAWRGEAVADIA